MNKIKGDKLISFSEIIEICGGIENYRKFESLQIKEIMSGISSGLRIDEVQGLYVNPKLPYEEMRIIKNKALFERKPSEELVKLRKYLLLVGQYYNLLEKDYLNIDEAYDNLHAQISDRYKSVSGSIDIKSEDEVRECTYALAHAAYKFDQEAALQNPKINKYVLEMKNK